MRTVCLLSLFFVFSVLTATAQSAHTLKGKVLDENGEGLIFANIFVVGTFYGTNSDEDGNFTLENIPLDTIEVQISFMGYKMHTEMYDFRKSNATLVVQLEPDAISMQQVDVAGKAQGQTKALLQQREAENIINVISSEQIEKFPDLNAADALQRVTGVTIQTDQGEGSFVQLRGTPPEYTNFKINGEQIPSPEGDVRYVSIGIISSDQIESIEVSKVLTPDMDGDGIAGAVNIVTKRAESETPVIRLSGAAGYNDLRQNARYNGQFSFGVRKEKFGFQLDANYYENNNGSDNLEFSFVKGPFWGDTESGVDNYHLMYRDMQLRYYDFTRKRIGLSTTFDYRFNAEHSVYVQAMFNTFEDKETRSRRIYDLEDAVDMYNYLYGSVEHDVRYRTKNQKVNTVNLGAENKFDFMELDYQLTFAQAKEAIPDRLTASFDNPGQALEITLDRDGTSFPKPLFKNPVHDSIAHDYANFEFNGLEFREDYTVDNNFTARINLLFPFEKSGKRSGYIKVGAKARWKNKQRDVNGQSFDDYNFQTIDRNRWDYIYPPTRPRDVLVLTDVSSGLLTNNLLNQGYTVEEIPDPTKMKDFYDFNAMFFKYGDNADTETRVLLKGLDYTATERITAAYAMMRKDLGKWMLQGGVRYENTEVDYAGNNVVLNDRSYYDTLTVNRDSRSHPFLLPMVNVKYSLNDNTNFRAAYTHSFSRPNFEDVLPIREQDRGEIRYGNPNLKYPLAKNMDLMFETYLQNNGIISVGAYYKNIENFIANYTIYAHEDTLTNSLRQISTAHNGKDANVFGAEIQANFMFNFLPGFLSNFGVYSTYAFTESSATIFKRPAANNSDLIFSMNDQNEIKMWYASTGEEITLDGETEKINLPGQARHSGNIALFYDDRKIYLKLTANYHDSYLIELGADADLDEYIGEAWRLDFNGLYRVNNHLKFFVDAVNLLNTPQTSFMGSTDYIMRQEYYSWWMRAGVKLTF